MFVCTVVINLRVLCMCSQGEQGEPGQKGSKGDKGEGVSLELQTHIHMGRSLKAE